MGLEGLLLERYYVTDINDAQDTLHSGALPEESITYRLYVDLLPGYRLQAVYGTKEAPMVLSSTANFYNHIESGQAKANIVPKRSLRKNTLLLDSWLTIGASGENSVGIPKKYDHDGLDTTLLLNRNFFKNHNKKCPSLWEYDGMVYSETPPFAEFFQMDSAAYYLGSSTNGKEIKITNGAYACLGQGAVGADSLTTNSVLIAQLTTKGVLSYRINLLIGAPDGSSAKYTYMTDSKDGRYHPALEGSSNSKKKKKAKSKRK